MGEDLDVEVALPSDDVTMKLRDGVADLGIGDARFSTGGPVFCVHPMAPVGRTGELALAPFCYDLKHPANAINATCHRFARAMPEADPDTTHKFKLFAAKFIIEHFSPPSKADLPTFHEWLANSSYKPKRKEYLQRVWDNTTVLDDRVCVNDSFIKAEIYQSRSKNPRAINSYSDASKVVLGPLFHCVDKATFKSKFFVKGTNPRAWPERVAQLFGERSVISTDFTSFEAHHRGPFAEVVYGWFEHMTQNLDVDEGRRSLVRRLMLGRNIIKFKHLNVECNQRLMSGALWTSSANGVLNLLINAYLAASEAIGLDDVDRAVEWALFHLNGLVEGDDGLFEDYGQRDEVAEQLGCVLKVERHVRCDGAGFCGIICDMAERQIIKDPKKFLRGFFILPARYRDAKSSVKDQLLRAKALSYYYSLSNCPVIGPVCYEVIRRTDGLHARTGGVEAWKCDSVRDAVRERVWEKPPCVTYASRLLCQREFGIDVAEQLRVEEEFARDPVALDLSGWSTADDVAFVRKYVRSEASHSAARRPIHPDTLALYEMCTRSAHEMKAIRESEPSRVNGAFTKRKAERHLF